MFMDLLVKFIFSLLCRFDELVVDAWKALINGIKGPVHPNWFAVSRREGLGNKEKKEKNESSNNGDEKDWIEEPCNISWMKKKKKSFCRQLRN